MVVYLCICVFVYLYVVYLDTVHIISFEGTVEHKNSVIFSFACCLDPNDILSPVKQKKKGFFYCQF